MVVFCVIRVFSAGCQWLPGGWRLWRCRRRVLRCFWDMLKSMLFENISVGKFGGFGGIAYLCTRFRERVPAAAGVTRGADAGPRRGFEKKFLKNLQVSKILPTFATFFAEPGRGSRNRTLKRLTIDNTKRRVVQEPARRCRVEIREAPCHSTNV